ncbi:10061_t:CDS:2 [Paraglomus occultum]|uniref:10061_t:CDS:1 n=1 Tax=Paraglomus occultum TaxID=144539 RepID=A0A9N9A2J6_9GLOM|nr:10061_t:CDS:2 [Paraglomus occultum]
MTVYISIEFESSQQFTMGLMKAIRTFMDYFNSNSNIRHRIYGRSGSDEVGKYEMKKQVIELMGEKGPFNGSWPTAAKKPEEDPITNSDNLTRLYYNNPPQVRHTEQPHEVLSFWQDDSQRKSDMSTNSANNFRSNGMEDRTDAKAKIRFILVDAGTRKMVLWCGGSSNH